jgi:hypothetical protein
MLKTMKLEVDKVEMAMDTATAKAIIVLSPRIGSVNPSLISDRGKMWFYGLYYPFLS